MLHTTNETVVLRSVIEEPEQAARALAARLQQGHLVLVLGAGVSIAAHIPMWHELVKRCCQALNVPESIDLARKNETSVQQLQHLMLDVLTAAGTESEYMKLVSQELYKDVPDDWLERSPNQLLIAMSALLMGAHAGTITDVVTYNFDDVIEQYLNHHGLRTQSIHSFPTLTSDVDVRVYHPHGFLARTGDVRSARLVFDRKSYSDRFAGIEQSDRTWQATLEGLLLTKQAVFIGLSGDDPLFQTLLPKIRSYLEGPNRDHRRYVGYWLFGSPAPLGTQRDLREMFGCAYVQLPSHQHIPRFLLRIRQLCAGYVPSIPLDAPVTPIVSP